MSALAGVLGSEESATHDQLILSLQPDATPGKALKTYITINFLGGISSTIDTNFSIKNIEYAHQFVVQKLESGFKVLLNESTVVYQNV